MTTFFVDAVNGSDSNDGQSAATAWKSIGQVNAQTFHPGDVIEFHAGDVYRQTLTINSSGTSDAPITFTSYGAGDAPVFKGSADLSGATWTETAPGSHIWTTAVATTTAVNVDKIFYNGDFPGQALNSQAALSNQGEWNWSGGTLSVYSNGNPATTLGVIEAQVARDAIAVTGVHDVVINGLTAEHGNYGIEVTNSNAVKIVDSLVDNNATHGVYLIDTNNSSVLGGEVHDNGVFRAIEGTGSGIAYGDGSNHNTVDGVITHGNAEEGVVFLKGTGDGNAVLNSESYGNKEDGIDIKDGTGDVIHGNYIHDNAVNGLNVNPDTTSIFVTDNVVSAARNAIDIDHDILVISSGNTYIAVESNALFMRPGAASGSSFTNDHFISSGPDSLAAIDLVGGTGTTFLNDIFVRSGPGEVFSITGTADQISIIDSILYAEGAQILRYNDGKTLVLDGDVLFRSDSEDDWIHIDALQPQSYSEDEIAQGLYFQQHGVGTALQLLNPMFIDPVHGDFRLAPASPLIGDTADNILGGPDSDVIFGQGGNDTIVGGGGNDAIDGGDDNDSLDGGDGNDTLIGADGNDTYVVVDSSDTIVEQPGGGIDLIKSSVDYSLAALPDVENLTLTGSTAVNATGNGGDNLLVGNDAANSIVGGGGNDTLDGGAGADTLVGGTENDTYVIDASDTIVENPGEGIDTIVAPFSLSLASFTTIENLTLSGTADLTGTGNDLDNVITGNAGANTLSGGIGNDTLAGGGGNDTYLVTDSSDTILEQPGGGTDTVQSTITYSLAALPDVENLTLTGTNPINGTGNESANTITGNDGANSLTGAGGNDVLIGNGGADTLVGGTGDDTYFIDALDTVVEAPGGGIDTLVSAAAINLTTYTEIENATLTGAVAGNIIGTGVANLLIGNSAANSITGADGNDTLDGGGGSDTLVGGTGDDTYYIESAGDKVTEVAGGGTDTVFASMDFTLAALAQVENLTLLGTGGFDAKGNGLNNILIGNSGANSINGAAGIDTLIGGGGNDTYVVDSTTDVIIEQAGGGTDTVKSSVTLTLTYDNVEILILTGAAAIDGTGNGIANTLTGNSAANRLDGAGGNDTINGGGGDTLVGGIGDDTFVVTGTTDTIVELPSEGNDTVKSSVTYSLAALPNVENVVLTGTGSIDATGNDSDNALTGNGGANRLDGGIGNDTLNGMTGADTLVGGIGNDTYVVSGAGTQIVENPGEGVDTVTSSITYSLASIPEVENLTLLGSKGINATGNAANNVLLGNAGANQLDGGVGADTMIGGLGKDTYIVDDPLDQVVENDGGGTDTIISSLSFNLANTPFVENLTLTGAATAGLGNTLANLLTGNGLNNDLEGNDGNDTLDGGAGIDTLVGGAGDDTFRVDSTTDVIVEQPGGGIADAVESSVTFDLGALPDVEKLFLTGTANINATGNDFDNALVGNSGNNVLMGLGGNDNLQGGLGLDTLIGGTGDDRYKLDSASTVVVELPGEVEGEDRIAATFSFNLNDYANVEDGELRGFANLSIDGTSGDNFLLGNGGANVLNGHEGNDTIDSGDLGGGQAGGDTMIGGIGDDTYIYAPRTTIVENPGEGNDTVLSTISLNLQFFPEVENLVFRITDNVEVNHANVDFTGNAKDNLIVGSLGENQLDGGAGADTLQGGAGNDAYILNDNLDTIIENPGEGIDVILAGISIDLSLYPNVENAQLQGSASLNLTGSADANVLTGNSGANSLDGAAGNDQLFGRAGADTLTGGTDDDALDGGDDNDSLSGGDGNDVLVGGAGTDTVRGDAGNDTITYDSADSLDGGADIDTLVVNALQTPVTVDLGNAANQVPGGAGTVVNFENVDASGSAVSVSLIGVASSNLLVGGAGDDSVTGGGGNDTLVGGAGVDTLIGANGNDVIFYDPADAIVDGKAAVDTLVINEQLVPVVVNLASGTDQVAGGGTALNFENVDASGSTVAVSLTGSAVANLLLGGSGADSLTGADGADSLNGGAGIDTVSGGTGNDVIVYDSADATIDGGADTDTLIIVAAGGPLSVDLTSLANQVVGGVATVLGFENVDASGFDLAISLSGTSAANLLLAGAGNDTVLGVDGNDTLGGGDGADSVDGGVGNDSIAGGAGIDTLTGGVGNDSIVYDGADALIDGGANIDTLLINTGTGPVTVDLSKANQVAVGQAAGFENVDGTGYLDHLSLTGSSGVNLLTGGAGGDDIVGGGGADTLLGADGNDTLDGGAGIDRLDGGAANDTITYDATDSTVAGGTGIDTLVMKTGAVIDLNNVADQVAAGGIATGFENVKGTAATGALQMTGDDTANQLSGGSSSDSIAGHGGDDQLTGANGDDTIDGGTGVDSIDAGNGNDIVTYDALDSTIAGSAGTDTLLVNGAAVINLGTAADQADGAAVVTGFENVDATASAQAVSLTGSSGVNVLHGGSVDDSIFGSAGADTLTGGGGNDIFRFAKGQASGDTITDFTGNGAAAGDSLVFSGFSHSATLTKGAGDLWTINDGSYHESFTLTGVATLDPSDFTFL